MKRWQDIEPRDATNILLPHEGMQGPLNEVGKRCPWPWDPQQLDGAPMGQYHCPYCDGMQLAGMEHMDWSDDEDALLQEAQAANDPMGTAEGEAGADPNEEAAGGSTREIYLHRTHLSGRTPPVEEA